jgi:lysophospholipase
MRATASKAAACLILIGAAACGGSGGVERARQPTEEERARAEAFLEANNTPLPANWQFERIGFAGDLHLRVGHAPRADGRATLLFVPGYTSSPELASDFLARWHELGFEVASVDLPGQGGSVRRDDDPHKTYSGDYGLYGEAVSTALSRLLNVRQSEGPVIVAGDSLGGHAVLRAAADGGLSRADALFPLVPAVLPETGAIPLPVAKAFAGLAILMGAGDAYMDGSGPWRPGQFRAEDYAFCGDREDRNFKNAALMTLREDLRVGGITNAFAHGMVTSGEEMLTSTALRRFDKPVAMLIAGREVIVRNDAAARLCRYNMPNCRLTEIEEATHCLYLEDQPTQDKVHAALLQLLERVEKRGG